MRVSCNVIISKMEFKDQKKEMCWFWKTEMNRKNTKEKEKP